MPRNKVIHPEHPPTKASDWMGAKIVAPPADDRAPKPGAMMFYVFRASSDSGRFAVTDRPTLDHLPPPPRGGAWQSFKSFAESGQSRVGMSEETAKADIIRQGYHLTSVRVSTRVVDQHGRSLD